MRKFIIAKSGGGELANQLWNYVSIYACALHTNARVYNPSFFEYHRYFNLWRNDSVITRFLSFWFRGKIRRREHPINTFWRRAYAIYVKLLLTFTRGYIYSSENQTGTVVYLPPTTGGDVPMSPVLYFKGWLFRNPVGLEQYGEEIRAAFSPADVLLKRISEVEREIRHEGELLIGVHFRQGDYALFKNGAYLLSAARLREIIDEYIIRQKHTGPIRLFVASDGKVPSESFDNYAVHISKENAVTDLFLLARCDVIIGSNSSFGHFASWYGNIPHIVAENGPMDWKYYADKTTYFPNKYATLAKL